MGSMVEHEDPEAHVRLMSRPWAGVDRIDVHVGGLMHTGAKIVAMVLAYIDDLEQKGTMWPGSAHIQLSPPDRVGLQIFDQDCDLVTRKWHRESDHHVRGDPGRLHWSTSGAEDGNRTSMAATSTEGSFPTTIVDSSTLAASVVLREPNWPR